jgi:hypothetical protein
MTNATPLLLLSPTAAPSPPPFEEWIPYPNEDWIPYPIMPAADPVAEKLSGLFDHCPQAEPGLVQPECPQVKRFDIRRVIRYERAERERQAAFIYSFSTHKKRS